MTDRDEGDARDALVDAYNSFVRLRDNANDVVKDAHAKLKETYRDAIDPEGGARPSSLRVDDVDGSTASTLLNAEQVAIYGPALGALAWSRSAERELRDLEYAIRTQAQRFAQLQRMWDRGPLGRRETPSDVRELGLALCNGGEVVCAICGRDFWSPVGRELALAPIDERAPQVVCWVCGDEHAPALTADLLAAATQNAERWLGGTTSYLEHWPAHLRRCGMEQRAIDFEEALTAAKETVRQMKAAALGDAETWLPPR